MATRRQKIMAEEFRREFSKQILGVRRACGVDQYFSEWKTRIDDNDRMYRGDWTITWPDGVTEAVKPSVINLNQVALDDLGRLGMEVQPQIRCGARGDDNTAQKKANLNMAIAYTYGDENDAEELNHTHILNLGQTGLALEAITFDADDPEYPLWTEIDPRGAYPRFVNNKLIDLTVVERMAKELVGPANNVDLADHFTSEGLGRYEEIEVIDYYDSKGFYRVLNLVNSDGGSEEVALISGWEHGLGHPCVSWARLKTADKAFRGFFDQLKGANMMQNRILILITDYAAQEVYAPFIAYDIENDTDLPGPKTVYRARSAEGKMARVAAASSSPELFTVMAYLERQARAGANYPESRQGEVSQSIASASFVNSTMGNLTTMVKGAQKEIARMWQRRLALSFEIDKKFCAKGPKPLCMKAGDKADYRTSDINDTYYARVLYGAGAGLDALNKKAAVNADVVGGLTSKRTAREQTDYLNDPDDEGTQIVKEQTLENILQRYLTSQDPHAQAMVMNFMQLLVAGKDPYEAVAILAQEEEKAQAEAQQAAAAQNGQGGGAPGIAPEAPTGMQNNGAPPPGPMDNPEGGMGPAPGRPQPNAVRALPDMETMMAAARGG